MYMQYTYIHIYIYIHIHIERKISPSLDGLPAARNGVPVRSDLVPCHVVEWSVGLGFRDEASRFRV